jgi:hypothetical protein
MYIYIYIYMYTYIYIYVYIYIYMYTYIYIYKISRSFFSPYSYIRDAISRLTAYHKCLLSVTD